MGSSVLAGPAQSRREKSSCGQPSKVHVCAHPWRDSNHGVGRDLRQTRGPVCRAARSPGMRSSQKTAATTARLRRRMKVCDLKYSSWFYQFHKPWNDHPDEYSRPVCWVTVGHQEMQNSSGFKTTGIILSFVKHACSF